ncbi:hypothetical protein Dsin_011965 [Dipteronia sinensis]|uniref:Uncharacterized protein n=1 Tax=Dipteronia sinensis TaxID=43782 RepID=A0AAE0AI33_9ROSI|nr:hypothetical protein Dsin_011965 [Dipteronia sinensis]
MGQQLFENLFDIQSCSVDVSSSKCESFVLPNLKLKVLIEAIRFVLEIVYDERFVTFSYGGRVIGRHTAIRFNSGLWWVGFEREMVMISGKWVEGGDDFWNGLELRW